MVSLRISNRGKMARGHAGYEPGPSLRGDDCNPLGWGAKNKTRGFDGEAAARSCSGTATHRHSQAVGLSAPIWTCAPAAGLTISWRTTCRFRTRPTRHHRQREPLLDLNVQTAEASRPNGRNGSGDLEITSVLIQNALLHRVDPIIRKFDMEAVLNDTGIASHITQ